MGFIIVFVGIRLIRKIRKISNKKREVSHSKVRKNSILKPENICDETLLIARLKKGSNKVSKNE